VKRGEKKRKWEVLVRISATFLVPIHKKKNPLSLHNPSELIIADRWDSLHGKPGSGQILQFS
jgi:hypothetical protein